MPSVVSESGKSDFNWDNNSDTFSGDRNFVLGCKDKGRNVSSFERVPDLPKGPASMPKSCSHHVLGYDFHT